MYQIPSLTWSVDQGGVIDPSTGLFSGTSTGTYTVTATAEQKSATASVTVKKHVASPPPAVHPTVTSAVYKIDGPTTVTVDVYTDQADTIYYLFSDGSYNSAITAQEIKSNGLGSPTDICGHYSIVSNHVTFNGYISQGMMNTVYLVAERNNILSPIKYMQFYNP